MHELTGKSVLELPTGGQPTEEPALPPAPDRIPQMPAISELRELARSAQILGGGRSAAAIPIDDNLVLRLGRGINLDMLSEADFRPHPNFQALRQSGVGYVIYQGPGDVNIQKRIHGEHFPYVPFPNSDQEREAFMPALRNGVAMTEAIANMPLESYERLIDDIALLTALGETIDANGGNLLINVKTESLHIIDISDPDSHEYAASQIAANNAPGQILPLLLNSGPMFVISLLSTSSRSDVVPLLTEHGTEMTALREKWEDASLQIIDKFLSVLEKRGRPFSIAGQSAAAYIQSYPAYSLRSALEQMRLPLAGTAAITSRIDALNLV